MSVAGARIDHLVVTAPDLERGVAWVAHALGVEPGPGGAHAAMGTHNRLLRLQDAIYFEVIAPDPSAPAPGRRRWFGLDDLAPDAPPRLSAWVVAVEDVDGAVRTFGASLGPVTPMSRGIWSWRLTVPVDGRQPLDGLAPVLIGWPPGRHPTTGMTDSSVRLDSLALLHPRPSAVQEALDRLGPVAGAPVTVAPATDAEGPVLAARFTTPRGPITLRGSSVVSG